MQASFPLRKRRCVSCALPRAHDWRNEAGPHVLLLHRMSTPLGAMHHARPHAMTAKGQEMARSRATIVPPRAMGRWNSGSATCCIRSSRAPERPRRRSSRASTRITESSVLPGSGGPADAGAGRPRAASLSLWASTGL